MSVVRLLGFATLDCGCVVGRYQDVHANREVAYVEEKGPVCAAHLHRRNHTIAIAPAARRFPASTRLLAISIPVTSAPSFAAGDTIRGLVTTGDASFADLYLTLAGTR